MSKYFDGAKFYICTNELPWVPGPGVEWDNQPLRSRLIALAKRHMATSLSLLRGLCFVVVWIYKTPVFLGRVDGFN
jgi:hypothetical protein